MTAAWARLEPMAGALSSFVSQARRLLAQSDGDAGPGALRSVLTALPSASDDPKLTAWLTETESIPLCRIQYLGDADDWAFALYQASTETYTDSRLPTGAFTGTPTQALDTALGLYLNDPTAWPINPPQD